MKRYHPWRTARIDHSQIPIASTELLPAHLSGDTDGRSIRLCGSLNQAQRRSVLAHELVHIERGSEHTDSPHEEQEERRVDEIAARRLIELDDLIEALVWTRGQPNSECAWELWTDVHTLTVRVKTLTADEREYIDREIERRQG